MSPLLSVFVLLYAVLLGCAALVVAVLRRRPGPGLVGGVVLLELTVIAQAVIDGVGLLRDRPAAEPATHLGYLVTSVVLLPLLLGITRPPRDRGPHPAGRTAAVIAVACVALAVVDVRMIATGPDAVRAPAVEMTTGAR